ncbi:hypothetical protein [Microbacterium sp. R86528]|uniref:hypothetical protein n=1 Tax=Microbacterium sp. R86528 TaxID=3093864 RepID=UPI0037CAB75B
MRRQGYPTYLHREPEWDENEQWTTTHWLSNSGGAWLRDLLARGIDVVWATTWQHAANEHFAVPLGLPELPIAVSGEGSRLLGSSSWKSIQLSRQFDHRPLLWVDDNPVPSPSLALPALRLRSDRVLTRFHWIRNWDIGITEHDVRDMNEWLELTRTGHGHEELRERRRRERDRSRATFRRSRWGNEAEYQRWRAIHGRLEIALGVNQSLPHVLAWYAFDHPNGLDPVEVTELVVEWGNAETPLAAELIRIIRCGNAMGA